MSTVEPLPTEWAEEVDSKDLAGTDGVRKTLKVKSSARLFGFADPEEIKKNIRAEILGEKKEYNVHDLYYETGVFQFVAKHHLFENITLAVISFNAIYIAIDTDWNKPEPLTATDSRNLSDSPIFFQMMEHLFCIYFSVEWIVRFCAFRRKCDCLFDAWFVFDSIMVILMVGETWVMTIVTQTMGLEGGSPLGNTSVLRLFRLLRLARLLRMLRSLPELMILIKGMVTAMTSVLYVMGLLVMLTYVFAIAFTQLTVGTVAGELFFANIGLSMYSLLIHATFMDDLAYFANELKTDELWYCLVLAIIFIFLASLTLMNMLVGVLCEVVSAVAITEKEEFLAMKTVATMNHVLEGLDSNQDKSISYKEFSAILSQPEALECFKEIGVDPMTCLDFADLFFFADGEPTELSFEEFIDVVMNLRESNQAKVQDIYNIWHQIKSYRSQDQESMQRTLDSTATKLEMKIEEKHDRLQGLMDEVFEELRSIQGGSPSALNRSTSPFHTAPTAPVTSGTVARRVTPAAYRRVAKS